MLTLYVKDDCPFCHRALPVFNTLEKIEKEVKNIADEGVVEELVEKGGKRQVPFLVDGKTGISMYESGDIIDYLKREYGAHTPGESIPKKDEPSGGVCAIE